MAFDCQEKGITYLLTYIGTIANVQYAHPDVVVSLHRKA